MRATTFLESQHRKLEGMFRRLEGSTVDPAQVVRELVTALGAHLVIEEEHLYPEARRVRGDLVMRLAEEHEVAAFMLRRVLATQACDGRFIARLRVLREIFKRHVRAEEHQLLPSVAKTIGEAMNETLGHRMEARLHELIQLGPEGVLAARAGEAAQPGPAARTPAI